MSFIQKLNDNPLSNYFWDLAPQKRALIFMFLAMFFFTGMSVFIRKSSEQLHIMEVIFLRNLLACFLIIPIMIPSGINTFKMHEPKYLFLGLLLVVLVWLLGLLLLF